MIAAALLVVVLVIVLAGVSIHYRQAFTREARADTRRLSFLLAEQAARTFESVDFTLRGLEPLPYPAEARNAAAFDALLRKRAAELSFVQSIRIMNTDGAVLAASDPAAKAVMGDRSGCLAALAKPSAPPLAIGCGSGDVGTGGQPAIAVARRLDQGDGTTVIAVAEIDPGYFSRFFRDLDLGPHALVTLTENNGHVLLASAEPEGEERNARTVIPPTEHSRLDRLRQASREEISAVHETDGYPLSVLVAVDQGDIDRRWRQAMTPLAVLTAGLSGLILALARVVERHRAERRQAHRRALVAQKMEAMGQMTASVAHDFRNVLTVMRGTVRLIRRRGPEAAILAEADATIDRGDAMVDRLLAFSRRTALRPEPHQVNDLVRHLEGTLRHVAGLRVALALELGDDLPHCQIDRIQFDAALMNLVVNAGQATDAGGSVTIRTRAAPGGVAVAVADTGCGIDEATLKRVFEPFFTTKAEHGTGLGLAQVQGFAEQIGGTVSIESALGRGTTVTLLLPRAAPLLAMPRTAPLLTLDSA